MNLNANALRRCQELLDEPTLHGCAVIRSESGACLIDCGVLTRGSLQAGQTLAEVCLAGLGSVRISGATHHHSPWPSVVVQTDHPLAACMASQYAGWQIAGEKYFAMGSGPMRAVRGREKLFDDIGWRERSSSVVGVLECSKLPPAEVCQHIANECGVDAENLTLLVARTASLAGTIQVVARSIETAMHKMHELGFRLQLVVSGFGTAPLPPIAADDLVGIGRTNDAILYGADVTLWVTGDDGRLLELGPQIPSCSSKDYGAPFSDIFTHYQRDFYKIDPLLFSPARITLINLDTGRSFSFGQFAPDVLVRSFATSGADV